MTLEERKNVVRRFNNEFIGRQKMENFDELIAHDIVDHNAIPGFPDGSEGVRLLFEDVFHAAFPDMRVEIHDQIAEGEKVVTRKTFHGTHTGPLMGIPPTNKAVTIEVIDIVRVADGRISEHWNVVDQFGLMQQLGVIPEPR